MAIRAKVTSIAEGAELSGLVEAALVKVATDKSGWRNLFKDPGDGRFWELTYPHSEMHGGGPRQLTAISREEAVEIYGANVAV